ncbi:MAG: pilin [Candidatus Altiarchaeota archaeon]
MKKKTIFALVLLAGTAAASGGVSSLLGVILSDYLCSIYYAMRNILGPLAVFILIIAGLKWLYSEEDPGARKQAKFLIENVFIGLVVVLAAGGIVYALVKHSPC